MKIVFMDEKFEKINNKGWRYLFYYNTLEQL